MKPQLKIAFKTTLLCAGMGFFLAGVILYIAADALYDRIHKEQERRINVASEFLKQRGKIHLENGHMKAGAIPLRNDEKIVDELGSLMGGAVTIFQGDERISTSVRLPDGSRATGTRLANSHIHEAVFRDWKSYRGESLIFGKPYFVAIDPIVSEEGELIGALQVGIKNDIYWDPVKKMLLSSILIVLFGSTIISGYLSHNLTRMTPIPRMMKFTSEKIQRTYGNKSIPMGDGILNPSIMMDSKKAFKCTLK
jgi:methyl-accepting chemotaxis protein